MNETNEMNDHYLYICKDDDGNYRLPTRTKFTDRKKVEERMSGVAPSREPILVHCDPKTVILRKEELSSNIDAIKEILWQIYDEADHIIGTEAREASLYREVAVKDSVVIKALATKALNELLSALPEKN